MLHITNTPKLSALTTLRLGGKAVALIDVPSISSLNTLPEILKQLGGTPLPFGRGSNILAADNDLPICLVRMTQTEKPKYLTPKESKQNVSVQIPASMKLPRLLAWCAKEGLSGLEPLAGIPGHVGGALAMNAGSFGTEFCSVLESIQYFTPQNGLNSCKASQCSWGYRYFYTPQTNAYILFVNVTLKLKPAPKKQILQNIKQHIIKKMNSQPIKTYSAGCVFKNPKNAPPAGKLLDDAGFRGKQLGGITFSNKHANFLINENNGNSNQAFELIQMAQENVASQTGIQLETEIRVLL